MTFLIAWVAFPLALAAVGAGWGLVVERASGARLPGTLIVPCGLAAAIVAAAILTTNGTTAPGAAPAVAVVAAAGLVLGRRIGSRWLRPGWPAVAAAGALVAYGAPVLASGRATFTGFVKLDDTATWLAITAHVFAHGRSTAGLTPSVYQLLLATNLGTGAYPVGAFMLLGVGRWVVHVDAAWVFQPYIACAGAALALCLYALTEPLVASRRLRALVAFVAAQPALLYGYSLWGGVKEMTAAFLVALVAALAAGAIRRPPRRPRALLPLAIAAAALIVTFGPATAVWVVPGLGAVAVARLVADVRGGRGGREAVVAIGWLAAVTVVLAVPAWIVLGQSLRAGAAFAGGNAAASRATSLGNLHAPVRLTQLAGIWPRGDFRLPLATSLETIALIGTALAAGAFGLWASVRKRSPGLGLYAGVASVGCLAIALAGGVPWVLGKAMAIASPAILLASMLGGAMLWSRSRPAGAAVLAGITGGVLWSNALGYHDATVAPAAPLGELARIGRLVAGRGPTFVNEYEIYADRYFLRAGDPVEPAEFRPVDLALRHGPLLTKPSWADLDSFGLQTLLPYRSIVLPRSPAESRPSSVYRLRWAGDYYELWERSPHPPAHVLAHIPFGDANQIPYCGNAVDPRTGEPLASPSVCSSQPAAPAPCPQVRLIAQYAVSRHAQLVVAERPPVTYVAGDQTDFPIGWYVSPGAHAIIATRPGRVRMRVTVERAGRYTLWLDGSFGRGFRVALDGRAVGRVHDELSSLTGYVRVTELPVSAGVHTVTLAYPGSGLAPGSGDELGTTLISVALERLGVDAIDLYQIHWPMPDDDIEEGWAALAALKDEGLVRHIGVSNFDVAQLRRLQEIAPVETLQPEYSLIERDVATEILPFADGQGIGVIVYSPMGSGLLTGAMTRERIRNLEDDDWRRSDPRFEEPQLSRHLALVERLKVVADRHDASPGAVAIAWTLRNPAVDGAIVGLRRPDQVDPLVAAATLELSDEDAAELEGRHR